MKEKVIDIYPPCEEGREEEKRCVVKNTKEDCSKKGWFLFFGILFFCLAGYFYYVSYRTEIIVYPEVEKFQTEEDVLVRAFGSVGDKEIRGIILSEKISETQEFPVEGRKVIEKKTTGEIEVCQDYRDSTVPFREGTRFVSDGGKTFLAQEAFTLPAREGDEGCAIVSVVAGEAGEDYNVPYESKFALPGLEGSSIYGNVKGVSFVIEEEGVLKEVPYLDDDTMERAESQIKEEILEKGKETIKEKYGEEYFLKSDAQYTIEIVEREFTEEETEEEAENFYFRLEADVKVVAIGKDNLKDFIEMLLPENYTWREETEELNVNFVRINFTEGEADMEMSFSADIYEKIDKEEWRRRFIGLSFDEVQRIIREEMNLEEATIKTRPFGFNRVVNSPERVEVILKFDKS